MLLYAAVEGNSPFRQNTPLSTLRAIVDEPLPVPRRAGPLAPVIEGLLAKDPAERTSADSAEHQLRVVAAGGTAPTRPMGAAPAASDAPTIAAFNQPSPSSPTPPRGSVRLPRPCPRPPPRRNRTAVAARPSP